MAYVQQRAATVPVWGAVTGGVLMLLVWGGLLIGLSLASEALLVPWDLYSPQARPPVGTLARTVNDAFETGMGGFALFLLPLAVQLSSLFVGLRQGDGCIAARLALRGAVLLALLLLAIAVAIALRPAGLEPGYDKTFSGIVVLLFGFVWFVVAHRRWLIPHL